MQDTEKGSNVNANEDVPNYGEYGEIRPDYVGVVMELLGDYNPETISIGTFRKMIHEDSQVSASWNFLIMAVLAKGWEWNHEGKDIDKAEEQKNVVKAMLNEVNQTPHVRGGLVMALREFASAIWAGFSVTEIVWDYHQKLKMHWPKKLKTLPPETIKFYSDNLGNMKEIWQFDYDVFNTTVFRGSEHITLPLDRLLIWSYHKEFGNKYGASDLKPCYKYWYIKDFVLKFWSIFIERYGSPFVLGKTRSARMSAFRNALKEIMTKTDLVIEKEDEAEILETKHEGEQFEKLINYCDRMIMLSFIVPSVILNPPPKGSKALGSEMMKAFGWRIKNIQEDIEFLVNSLTKQIIDYNFPESEIEAYPKFKFKPLTQYDLMKMAQAVELLVRAKVIHPTEKWIRDYMTLPDADPEVLDLLLEAAKLPSGEPEGTKPTFGVPNIPQTAPPEKTKPEAPYQPQEAKQRLPRERGEDSPISAHPRMNEPQDTLYKEEMDTVSMERFLDRKENELYNILAEWLDGMPDLVFAEMSKVGLTEEGAKALDEMPPPFDMKLVFKVKPVPIKALQKSLNDYFTSLTSETVTTEASNLMEMGMTGAFDVEARLGALNYIEQNMAQRMNLILAKGGNIATDMQYNIWKKTRDVVLQGLNEGMDLKRIRKELKVEFGRMYSAARIQTIARTNANYAYNAGRIGFYKANKDFVKAVEYSAVIDRRTTPFCSEMDTTVFNINDPAVERYTPPNHFQCRSTWLPVTYMDTDVEPNFDEESLTNNPQEGFSTLMGVL